MPDLIVSEYVIPGDPRRLGADDIRIARVQQAGGEVKWAARRMGQCLSHDGEWEYEPLPSSRDEVFLARCRFDSPEEAAAACGVLQPVFVTNPAEGPT